MQIKSSVDGLDILIGTFHLDPCQGPFPRAQPMPGEGGKGNAAFPEVENVAAIRYIRLTGEKSGNSIHGDSPVFVQNHPITSFPLI